MSYIFWTLDCRLTNVNMNAKYCRDKSQYAWIHNAEINSIPYRHKIKIAY